MSSFYQILWEIWGSKNCEIYYGEKVFGKFLGEYSIALF